MISNLSAADLFNVGNWFKPQAVVDAQIFVDIINSYIVTQKIFNNQQ